MEKFESNPMAESDFEKSKRTFIEAVQSTSVVELDTDFNEADMQSMAADIKSANLFLLGEMHGVRENTDVIYTLFKKFGFRKLALEWTPSQRETLVQFVKTGVVDFESIKDSPDGRITAGHFALIRQLQKERLLDDVICFDQMGEQDWNHRDAMMAESILKHATKTPTLVVAGNLHTSVSPLKFEDEVEELHPMGELVRKALPTVPTGSIEYMAGEFYNLGVKRFELDSSVVHVERPTFARADDGRYVFRLPNAHAAIVPNTTITENES